MALVTVHNSRSGSPKGIKNNFFIQIISKKFIRRSREDLEEDDGRSFSTDASSNSASGEFKDNAEDCRSQNLFHKSMDVANEGNVNYNKNKRQYSTSAESIMRLFETLTIKTRSKSCSNADKDKKKSKKSKKSKKPPPKRILRSPVKYVYAKGWSGLPTQRIPVSGTYVSYAGGCRMQYKAGLGR